MKCDSMSLEGLLPRCETNREKVILKTSIGFRDWRTNYWKEKRERDKNRTLLIIGGEQHILTLKQGEFILKKLRFLDDLALKEEKEKEEAQ